MIQSDSNMEMNGNQLSFFWATHLGKRTLKTVKLLELNALNCLHKIGLKMRE